MTSELLADLIVHELCSIPADKWGFFFPAHVALWRFIRTTRPDVLGELSAEYTDEPVFHGRGAEGQVRHPSSSAGGAQGTGSRARRCSASSAAVVTASASALRERAVATTNPALMSRAQSLMS